MDDIPEALRETSEPKPQPRVNRVGLIIGLATIALGAGGWLAYNARQASPVIPFASPLTSGSIAASPSASPAPNTLLGHLAYAEAPQAELQTISGDGGIKLRKSAAEAFRQMSSAAQAEGIILAPLSAFRSLSDQQHVFFEVKAERSQTPNQRAEVSAPPGYSEHHTGYAIDIGDGNVPATNLSPSFDQTAAFNWLKQNAVRFNFEVSFPKNNSQGVSYEPWHWRFVGDRQSLETFYKARGKQ
ncbi:MAG: D-alanyl-D-alanine carboxypeptidase family protein [Phormidesmis sp. CAN_BIN44]|nr:D-alanyl-D-alanine carboxypeptidase family protein [Phormidesmis sp. CAN_BIN44]